MCMTGGKEERNYSLKGLPRGKVGGGKTAAVFVMGKEGKGEGNGAKAYVLSRRDVFLFAVGKEGGVGGKTCESVLCRT